MYFILTSKKSQKFTEQQIQLNAIEISLQGLNEYKFSLSCCVVHISNEFYYVNLTLQKRALLTYICWRGGGHVLWNRNFHIWYTLESLTSDSPWQKEAIYHIITSVRSLIYSIQTRELFETKLMTSPIPLICWRVSVV